MVPLVRPVTVMGLDAPDVLIPSGSEVTVYKIIGLPPFETGAAKLTVARAFPAVAVTALGAPGTVAGIVGVTLLDGLDGGPVPTALVAVTVKV